MPTASDPVETKETVLAIIPEAKALEVFLEGKGIDELLSACEEKALAVTTDASTAKGRAEIKSMAYLVARTKTAFDAPGKALSAEYKEKPKTIDGNRKLVADFLEDLQKRVRKPLTDWESAEKARIEAIKNTIQTIRDEGTKAGDATHALGLQIEFVEGYVIDEAFAEFQDEAQSVKDSVLAKLYAAKEAALKREAEAAELTRLREEQAKRDQADREAKIAQEAAENATREANKKAELEKAESEARELRAQLAQKEAEREAQRIKDESEAKTKKAVEDERLRVEAEAARLREEGARREADKSNQFRVHSEAVDDLQAIGIEKALAIEIVYAVRDGKIRNLSLKY
jgi:chromosome segregation ATPase